MRSVRSGASGSVIHTGPHVQARVAVSLTLPHGIERTKAVRSGPTGSAIGTLGVEWQCHLHGTARSSPSGSVTRTATWHRAYQSGTLRGKWQCDRYARGRVAVPPTPPLDVECVGAVRSVPSGSAIGTLGVEWQCYPHCHSTLNVWGQYAQARVAVRVGVTFGSVGVMPTSERFDRGVPQPCPGRPPCKWQGVSVQAGRFLGWFGRL